MTKRTKPWAGGFLAGAMLIQTVALPMASASAEAGTGTVTSDVVTLEAEAAQTGWEPVVPLVGGITTVYGKTDDHGHSGQTVIFDVSLEQPVTDLSFKYRTDNNPKFDVVVDGRVVADDITFGATPGGWGGGMVEKSIKTDIPAGRHTVKLVMVSEGQYVNVDSLIAGNREYEVEDASFAPVNHGISFSTGYVEDFKDEGDFLTFDVHAAAAGVADLKWKYKNDAASMRPAVRTVYVNGEKKGDVTFTYTGDVWSPAVTTGVALQEGVNQVTIKQEDRDDDGVKLDFLQVGHVRYHAEKASFIPPMTIYKNMLLDFGHVGDQITFSVNLEQAGETSLIFTYANAGSVSTKTLYIDGQPAIGGDGKPVRIWFNGTGSRDSLNEDTYYVVPYMSAGAHTVTLKHEEDDKGSIDLRKLTVGFFDEPSIRLMDAGLAAMGATHIELGTAEKIAEGPNMLAHEYYPNRSKKMKPSLKESMKDYYKFLTAYENVLFDSVEDTALQVTAAKRDGGGEALPLSRDGAPETIWAIARKNAANDGFERYDILHMINLLNNDDNWRNAAKAPEKLANLKVTYPMGVTAQEAPGVKVYAASPDHDGGMLKELVWSWKGTDLEITLPELNYWEMIVIDRDGTGLQTVTASGQAAASVPAVPIRRVSVGKARYAPGEAAAYSVQLDQSQAWSGTLHAEFYQMNRLVGQVSATVEQGASEVELSWNPPSADFQGYQVKVYVEGRPEAFKTAALDVSSDWTRFPRYGYVTEFPKETMEESDAKLKQLSQDYYLNGYQFYDWMWRHDVSVYSKTDVAGKPLRDPNGSFVTAPIDENTSYADLLGRHLYPLSVKQQVAAAQKYGSAAMAYQMNYAAREHYEDFGVKREWGLYNKNTTFPDPDPIKFQNGFYFDWVNPPTALYLQDPGNPEWQAYINKEFDRSVNEFGFDGIHLDQWGASDSDFLYDYEGNPRYYSKDYDSLINSVKDSLTLNNPNRNHVTFNMVGGNAGYADVPNPETKTDFDYSEIWQDKDRYRDLKQVVDDTRLKDGGKAMVIAGYMNYKQAVGDHYEVSGATGAPRTEQFQSGINKIPGWVGDFGKKDEDQISWTLQAPEAGEYDLILKYGHGNGGGSPEGKLTVNGEIVAAAIPFTQKTGWGNPIADAVVRTTLQAGDNTVKLQLNTNDLWLNVDSLNVRGGSGITQVYEAEYAELLSCKVDKYGHVYNFDTEGDYITFEVQAPADGEYPVDIRYGIEAEPVTRQLWVNDSEVPQTLEFTPTGGWEMFKAHKANLLLHAGTNTITLKAGASDTGMKVDGLGIGSSIYEAEKASIGWMPTRAALIKSHPAAADETYVTRMKNAPDYVEFDVSAETAGMYKVGFQYATANNPTGHIFVNGRLYGDQVLLTSTGGWGGDDKWGLKTMDLPLNAGSNKIRLVVVTTGQYLNLDALLIQPSVITVTDSQHITAAGGVELAGSGESSKTDNFNGDPAKSVTFTLDAAEAGSYKLGFLYRTANQVQAQANVNGSIHALDMTGNGWYGGDWWGLHEFVSELQQGSNTITLKLNSEDTWLNLHGLVLIPNKLEAEAPETLVNGVTKGSAWTDDFGQSGDSLAVQVEQAEAGLVPIGLRYKADEAVHYELDVNGTLYPITFSTTSGGWQEITVPEAELQVGTNTIRLIPAFNQNASIQLDRLTIGSTPVEAEADTVVKGGSASVEAVVAEVGYLYDFKQQGDLMALSMGPVNGDGLYRLTVAYRNPGVETQRSVYMNGSKAGTIVFAAHQADWSETFIPVYLSSQATSNTIMIKMEAPTEEIGLDIDRLTLGFTGPITVTAPVPWEDPVIPPSDPTPTPSHNPGSVTVPVPAASSPAAEVVVNEASLKNAKDGKIEVSLKNNEKTVLLPVQALQGKPIESLALTKGHVRLAVPGSIFTEAAALAGDKEDARIAVTIEELTSADSQALTLAKPSPLLRTEAIGAILELSIRVLKGDKALGTIEAFEQPVELSFSYDKATLNSNLLGIYYYNEAAQAWEYVGGSVDKEYKKVTAQLYHFSKYALMWAERTFEDLPTGHWAEEAVQTLAAKHIIDGKTASTYDPDGTTTRAEFAALLARALGLKTSSLVVPFQDVNAAAWYAEAVAAAYEGGLLTGKTETTFAPYDPVTREEMAAMLVRAWEHQQGEPIERKSSISFDDGDQISPWAMEYVGNAVAAGLMEGTEDKRFDPLKKAKRSETAQVIYNLLFQ